MNRPLRNACAAIVACAFSLNASGEVLTAAVTGGDLQGVAAKGVVVFKGIPYAAPPVRELRWKPPQPLAAWVETKTANAFGPSCMQGAALRQSAQAPPGFSENCLYLNVWTPAQSASERLPVMVWIPGGGFANGSTSMALYDGARLAEKDVVLVSLAYRVGVFGFLAHPELSRESGKGSGNYGLLDMVAGLTWVKDNIAAFGGDPRNVTIFGESAGGIAVSMLAASPAAKDLFAKVISESGGSFAPSTTSDAGEQNVPTLALAESRGRAFLAKLAAGDIAAARALPADAIQTAQGGGWGAFWPVEDGVVLPGDQYVLYGQGRFNDTPVLIGSNSDEGALFVSDSVTSAEFEQQMRALYGEHAGRILAVNPHATDAEALQAARNVLRDAWFGWPTWTWARLQSRKGRGAAYVYYFDHRTPQSPNGAWHTDEIAYVFRNPGAQARPAPRPEDAAMSELVSSYWVNFAKAGNPNGPELPLWPAFTEQNPRVMVLDSAPSARPVPNLPQLEALDMYYASRRELGSSR